MWSNLIIAVISLCLVACRGEIPEQQLKQTSSVPSAWRRVDMERFVLFLPPDMERREIRGEDSAFWEFRSDTSRLVVNLGMHTDDLVGYKDWPEFHEENIRIDSHSAKVCTFRHSEDRMDSADDNRLF